MAELQLKSQRFRAEREADWRRLERLLERIERGGLRKLSLAELMDIPVLYRQALSSLAVARAISLDQSLVDYLEALCGRAYFLIYGARTSGWSRVAAFFVRQWPMAVRHIWRETLAATLMTALAALLSYGLVTREPDWFYSLVPAALAEGRDPQASAAFLRGTLHSAPGSHHGLDVLASFLFTHNAQIAIFAFALGFAFCVLTTALLIANGATLGAFLAVFARQGLAAPALGWLMVHGVTELFAITLAGAAGLSMGWSVAFPGGRRRTDAVMQAGRRGAVVMGGVLVMLFCAALLEGFVRQLVDADLARYAIAAATGVFWAGYFYLPRGKGAAA